MKGQKLEDKKATEVRQHDNIATQAVYKTFYTKVSLSN